MTDATRESKLERVISEIYKITQNTPTYEPGNQTLDELRPEAERLEKAIARIDALCETAKDAQP